MKKTRNKVLVRGGGDLGSGIARRLHLAGLNVVILELPFPRAVRRVVSFAAAVQEKEIYIEGIRGVLCTEPPPTRQDFIPVIVDENCRTAETWNPDIIIDARMQKKTAENNKLPENRFILGIGPYFEVGKNCHAIVETNRGPSLGHVIWKGTTEKNTRVPTPVCGFTTERILRAPVDGEFQPFDNIGDPVSAGDKIGVVGSTPVHAQIDGILRGVLYPGTYVTKGQKIGDIDPRSEFDFCFTISDKSNAIANGAMEAVLLWINR